MDIMMRCRQWLVPLTLSLLLAACAQQRSLGPMAAAAAAGDVAAMEQALAAGHGVAIDQQANSYPLLRAVQSGKPAAVRWLLDHGAMPEIWSINAAVATGNSELLAPQLVKLTPDSPLLIDAMESAMAKGEVGIYQQLKAFGVVPLDPKRAHDLSQHGQARTDAMLWALIGGKEVIVRDLLASNADWRLHEPRPFGDYDGFGAATQSASMSLLCIMAQGIVMHQGTNGGWFMTWQKKPQGDGFIEPGTLALLLKGGQLNRPCSDNGMTPLMKAVARPSDALPLVKMLVAAGANPRAVNAQGSNALHYVAMKDSPELAGYLIQAGVNPNARNQKGHTPLDIAVYRGYDNTERLLRQNTRKQTTGGNDGALLGKLIASAGLTAVGLQADLPIEQTMQVASAATRDIWLEDGQGSNLAQLQQQALAASAQDALAGGGTGTAGAGNPSHGPKKPLRNQGVCSVYTIDNFRSADLVGEPQIDTQCATGIVHYRAYLDNHGRPDTDAGELEKVYRLHELAMENADKTDKATRM